MKTNITIAFILIATYAMLGQNPTLSDGWYRIPYVDGTNVKITRDWVDHGNNGGSQASENEGRIDMIDVDGVGTLVAAADGVVTNFKHDRQDCGCHSSYASGCPTNFVTIEHPNGERSQYVHVAFNSVVVSINENVVAGQIIATEGDVGYTCGNTRAANTLGNDCPTAQVDSATSCGRHLHFTVTKNGNFLNPKMCSPDVAEDYFIFEDNATYEAAPCGNSTCADTSLVFVNNVFDGVMRSYPTQSQIAAGNNVQVKNTPYTSIDFQAGDRVLLGPGFVAEAGSFFRAHINNCGNNTFQDPIDN